MDWLTETWALYTFITLLVSIAMSACLLNPGNEQEDEV